jgi:hypothetical protein
MKGLVKQRGSCPDCGHAGINLGAPCPACGWLLGKTKDPEEETVRMHAFGMPSGAAVPAPQLEMLPDGVCVALEATAGPSEGMVFPVRRRTVVIGREGGEIRIPDPAISRRHASLEVLDASTVSETQPALTILLRDLSSTNGTYHNGQLIAVSRLEDGDEITIGRTVLILSIDRR